MNGGAVSWDGRSGRATDGMVLLLAVEVEQNRWCFQEVHPEGEESDRPEGSVGSGEGHRKDGRF